MAAYTTGEHIIALRNTYSISREILAERSGVSVELITRIEEAGHIPDLAPLIKIARALGVRLGTLLDDHEILGPVITRAEKVAASARFVTGMPEKIQAQNGHHGLCFQALAADKNGRHMEPFIIDIQADAQQDKTAHEGEEFIHVIEGNLRMEYGVVSDVLKAGDSVYYDSIVPHRVISADSNPVRILAVIYTPV